MLVFLGHSDHVSVLQAPSTGLNDLLLRQESRTERREGSKDIKYRRKERKWKEGRLKKTRDKCINIQWQEMFQKCQNVLCRNRIKLKEMCQKQLKRLKSGQWEKREELKKHDNLDMGLNK